jgi:hypothetical protein
MGGVALQATVLNSKLTEDRVKKDFLNILIFNTPLKYTLVYIPLFGRAARRYKRYMGKRHKV